MDSKFSSENNHRQNSVDVSIPLNTLSFLPQDAHILSGGIALSIQCSQTFCTTHKFGLCSKEPHAALLQFTHFPVFGERQKPSAHSNLSSCVHSKSKKIYVVAFSLSFLILVILFGLFSFHCLHVTLMVFIEKVFTCFTVLFVAMMRLFV